MVKRGSKVKKLNRIAEFLEEHGVHQSWFAGALDMEIRSVNRYATNARQPSLTKLYQIAKVLKVSALELIYENLPK
jgi:putative transcriptional regulator